MSKLYRKIIIIALLLALAVPFAVPLAANAQEQKVVRVGWFDSSFCYRDQFGRRCGVAYEYQHKIAAYTGWTYEYVEDSWPNLFEMLKDGEIDLLCDVSFKPERQEFMSFPELPMGTESYYIYIDAQNRDITADKPETFNGKRIGVNRGSVQESFLKEWAEKNHVEIQIVPMLEEEDESMEMVMRGELDGYASIFTFSSEQKVIPICRVGSSDYFYAVNKNRPDLLAELNMALAGIQDEDPYFNQRLSEERLYNVRTNAFLSPTQEDWLKNHGVIRIGYLDDYLPFCQTDKETGMLTGALKDYLAHAANNLRNAGIRFETVPYASTQEALDALKRGEVNCAFPIFMSTYDCDETGIWLTNPAMKTEMNAVMPAQNNQTLTRDGRLSFAVDEGNLNVRTFIMDQYPASERTGYAGDRACLEAVASGKADCALISNYRIPAFEGLLNKYKLSTVPTGESMQLSFAVNRADRELYFLLNKTVLMTDSEDVYSALVSYARFPQHISFTEFLKNNWVWVMLVLSALFTVIIVLLVEKLKAERRANEQQRLLEEAAEIAELKQTISSLLDNMPGMTFTKDAETGVYLACNQAFAEHVHKKSPAEVAGLTDEDIFDAETAKHYKEDDRMALSMDEPFIFYDDEPDADGNMRQVRTTRLKYTDASGRLCVLGICQDVTNPTRIRRETATSKEAYENARSTGIIYTHLAQALARSYEDLYYINLNTEQFVEYRTDSEHGGLFEVRRGWHFFEQCREDAERFVHPDDRAAVIEALDRKKLIDALDRNKSFVLTYRLLRDGKSAYVTTKVTRMEDDDRYIILGVTDVDEQMRHRRAAERMKEERIAYARLNALTGDFLGVYVVVPKSGRYREFSAGTRSESYALPRDGMDFFIDIRSWADKALYTGDLSRFQSTFTKDNVMSEIARRGIFTLSFRVKAEGRPRYVQMKAAPVEETEGQRLVVGVNDIDAQVQQEEEYLKHLAMAKKEANVDALTGVKNRHAYLVAEDRLNHQMGEDPTLEFAIVLLDVNDLKKINDIEGHNAGDQYLRAACKTICTTFKHSPVFRIGGDEFAVIAQGSDYENIAELMERMRSHNESAVKNGGIVIACGMAKRKGDESVAQIFERADQRMYDNKNDLKAKKQ